jgi:hypothetical protein
MMKAHCILGKETILRTRELKDSNGSWDMDEWMGQIQWIDGWMDGWMDRRGKWTGWEYYGLKFFSLYIYGHREKKRGEKVGCMKDVF